jgi:menaquinone-dependent protoporphyrinogen oxidase
MKTLILYTTKHGATREIAQRIAAKMGGAAAHDLKQGNPPPLADYDCVILGGSLYVGALAKEMKEYIAQNKDALAEKRLGLFVSGLGEDMAATAIEANFPPELRQAAKASSFLGGVFDPKITNVMERLVMKAVAKTSAYTNTADDKKLDQFVAAMQK